MGRPITHDMLGFKTGQLTVIARSDREAPYPYWVCKCSCGGTIEMAGHNLRRAKGTESCGCRTAEVRSAALRGKNLKHGLTQGGKIPPEYESWRCMLRRCYEPNFTSYPAYGAKGIRVCSRWHDFGNFYEDMGPRPTEKSSIERLNGKKDYSPTNCVWANGYQQANNRSNNVLLRLGRRTMTLAQWARETGLRPNCISMRLAAGWSVKEALTTPVRRTSATR